MKLEWTYVTVTDVTSTLNSPLVPKIERLPRMVAICSSQILTLVWRADVLNEDA